MPNVLITLALPLAVVAAICAVVASVASGQLWTKVLQVGRIAWAALATLSVLLALGAAGDWVHLIWAIQFPMFGLVASSGLLLVRARPREAKELWGPGVLFGVFAVLTILPLALLLLRGTDEPTARAGSSLVGALADVVHYGFGGPVPDSMLPQHSRQLERGLGSPERDVTVSMGALWLGSGWMALLAGLSLLTAFMRTSWVSKPLRLLVPPIAATLVLTQTGTWAPDIEEAMWHNDAWYVGLLGPLLLAAVTLVPIALLVHRHRAAQLPGSPVLEEMAPRSRRSNHGDTDP
jgi:hypothetical protein